MKILFFKTLLCRANKLTPSEKILYSFLVSKSIANVDDIFQHNGTQINLEVLFDEVKRCRYHIPICELNNTKIAEELCQQRKTIIESLKRLIDLGFMGNDWIYVNKELVEHGFFRLEMKSNLKGNHLIFYSYLLDKSAKYHYRIDTRKKSISEKFGKSEVSITKYLNKLYKEGLAEREQDGKLLIIKPKQ